MGYRAYMTREGYAIQAKLFAEGGNFEITRVAIGSGKPGQGDDPAQFAALVEERAPATSTKVRRAGCEVAFAVEYRSELAPELDKPFQINELAVYAKGVEGETVLALYVDFSDCPDTAVPLEYGGCVRRWPINITIGPDATVSLAYPAGAWMTHEEAEDVIDKALKKGLDMGDGTSVPEAVAAMQENLTQTKAEVAAQVATIKQAVDGSRFYRLFEPGDWTGDAGESKILRVPATEHGMAPTAPSCISTVRQRLGRTAAEFDVETAAPVAGLLLAAVKAALAANAVPDPDPEAPTAPENPVEGEPEAQAEGEDAGTTSGGEGSGETDADPAPTTTLVRYPVAEDGHVILTWEQVQYLLLESTSFEEEGATVWNPALVSAEEAEDQSVPLGYALWKERDNGVEPTVTLDEILTAAYLPALGGPSASFEAMITLQVLQGLRLRRGTGTDGFVAKYDMDGYFSTTWGTMGTQVLWDLNTGDLVLEAVSAYPGDLMIMGPADVGDNTQEAAP